MKEEKITIDGKLATYRETKDGLAETIIPLESKYLTLQINKANFVNEFNLIVKTIKFSDTTSDNKITTKAYVNKIIGYTLEIPSDWQVDEDPNGSVQFLPPTTNELPETPRIQIFVNSKPIVEAPQGNKTGEISEWSTIVVDGVPGYFYKREQCAPLCDYRIDLPYKYDTLTISISTNSDLGIFNKILWSFRWNETNAEGKPCGGFAGETGQLACPGGYYCQYPKPRHPDEQGKCIKK